MLNDTEKANIETYLLKRDKDFKVRQEDAIRHFVDKKLISIEDKRREWTKFIATISGASLIGAGVLFWNGLSGYVKLQADRQIKEHEEKFDEQESRIKSLALQYEVAQRDLLQKAQVATQLQNEAESLILKLSTYKRSHEIDQLVRESFTKLTDLEVQVEDILKQADALERRIDFVATMKPSETENECTIDQYLRGDCGK